MILVLTTLEREASALTGRRQEGQEGLVPLAAGAKLAVLKTTGRRAAWVAESLLKAQSPDALLSIGFAGGLHRTLREGDLVLGTRTAFHDGQEKRLSWSSSDEALLQRARTALAGAAIPYLAGDVITVWKAVGTPSEKERLAAATDGLVVDMEGSWIATAAKERGVPFLLVRAVVDPASLVVPGVVAGLAGLPAWGQWLGAGLLCLLTPWNVPHLLRLKRRSRAAATSLARFLHAFLSVEGQGSAPASATQATLEAKGP